MLVDARSRWLMRISVLVVWAALTALLAYGAETVDPHKRVVLALPLMMLWAPLTGIMVLIWNPRHRLYW